MTDNLDEIDRKILDLLQRDARMTNAAIAAEVGLTAPSVFERIRKLEGRGVIRGYTVNVDPAALGKPLTAFIRLMAAFDDKYSDGVEALRNDPDVLECYHVAGEDCFVIKTRFGHPGELEELINRIRRNLNVQRSVTMIALKALKEGGALRAVDSAATDKPAASRRKNV